jgi:hypothetical protein
MATRCFRPPHPGMVRIFSSTRSLRVNPKGCNMTLHTLQKLERSRPPISATTALRLARLLWFVFLCAPFLAALWVSSRIPVDRIPISRLAEERWFVAAMLYVVLIAPAAFFWREHIHSHHRPGEIVRPGKYLMGMIGIWLALLSSAILSLAGCVIVESFLPNIIPAFFALMLFLMLWPSG